MHYVPTNPMTRPTPYVQSIKFVLVDSVIRQNSLILGQCLSTETTGPLPIVRYPIAKPTTLDKSVLIVFLDPGLRFKLMRHTQRPFY